MTGDNATYIAQTDLPNRGLLKPGYLGGDRRPGITVRLSIRRQPSIFASGWPPAGVSDAQLSWLGGRSRIQEWKEYLSPSKGSRRKSRSLIDPFYKPIGFLKILLHYYIFLSTSLMDH